MNKSLLTIILLTVLSVSYGQVITNKKIAISPESLPCINIEINDAETGLPLEGAVVRLVFASGDTVSLISNRFGSVNYFKKTPKDSVKIIINYLGYEEIRHTQIIHQPQIYLIAKLKIDPININSIIIQGEHIAMVIRGDTTIYNAGAFKTMDGDPMYELLKKLPGVEIQNSNVFVNGQIIKRILVNGSPIFANNTKSAIELIRADNIEKVKVYEEYSAKDKALGDTVKTKDRVLDVTTKKKVSIVKQIYLQTSYGVYLEENDHNSRESLYSLQGQNDRHQVGNNLIAMFGYGEKSTFSGSPAGAFGNDISGLLKWDKSSKDFKYNFQSTTILSSKKNSVYSSSEKDFSPNTFYSSRQEFIDMSSNNLLSNITSNNGLTLRFHKRHRLSIHLGLTGARKEFNNSVYNNILLNGVTAYLSNMERSDNMDNISFNSSIKYNYNLGKPRRDLTTQFSYSVGAGFGNGWNIDTLASGTQEIFLSNNQDNNNYNFGGEISYTEPLTKRSYLFLQYVAEKTNSKSELLSVDRITGLGDQKNSFDYSQNYLAHKASTRFLYNSNEINLNVGIGVQLIQQDITDRLPNFLDKSRTYKNLTPNLLLKYTKLPHLFELDYSETVSLPFIEQLRDVLYTYNSPLYITGNPSLKETTQRSLNLKYSITDFKTFSSWIFNVKADFFQNAIVLKEEFFSSSTIIQKYGDFEFPTGSTLQTTENAMGRFSINSNIKYSSRSKLLNSRVTIGLNYSYDKIPYYLKETLLNNNMQAAGLNIGIISDFSEKLELMLSSETSIGYYERDENTVLKEVRGSISSNIRWNLCKRVWLNANGMFRTRNTNVPGTSLNEIIVNTELLYRFGKDYNGNISLNFNDIFDQYKSFSVLMKNDYIQTQRMAVLGRNLYLKISYAF